MSITLQMAKLTEGVPSKSEKMRRLAKAGYSRGDIARFLGTSYQFVRNVLVREETRAHAEQGSSAVQESRSNRVRLGPSGQVTLPASLIQTLGLNEGDTLVATAEDGEIRLMTIPTAVRKVQAMVRQYVPEQRQYVALQRQLQGGQRERA